MRSFVFHTAVAGFAIGIALYFLFSIHWTYGAGVFLIGLAGIVYRWRSVSFPLFSYTARPYILIFLLFLGLGISRAWYAERPIASQFDGKIGETITFEGIIVRDPEYASSGKRFVVKTDKERVLVYGPLYPIVEYGDLIRVEGKLEVPEPFETDTGRLFDYPRFLAKDGIHFVLQRALVEIVSKGEWNVVLTFFVRMKHLFVDGIERSITEPASGLAAGVVLGVEGSLSKADEEAFRIASLIHIVVVSGYNITMAGNAVAAVFSAISPFAGSVGGVTGVLSYVLLTGASSTAVRAGIMACIMVLARITKRRYDVVRALLAAGLFMSLHTPHVVLYDPSFQLSFLATWGLVKIAPIFERHLGWITERLGLREIVATTLGAQTAVTPLLLYQSGSTHLLSLFANIVVLPAMPIFMLASLLSGLAGLAGRWVALPFAVVVELVSSYVFYIVKLMGIASGAIVEVGGITPWMLVGVYVVLVVGVENLSTEEKEESK